MAAQEPRSDPVWVRRLALAGLSLSLLYALLTAALLAAHRASGLGPAWPANLPGLLTSLLLLLGFWRLYHLRRWGGGLVAVLGWLYTASAMGSGVWQWTAGWAVASALATLVVVTTWSRLSSDF